MTCLGAGGKRKELDNMRRRINKERKSYGKNFDSSRETGSRKRYC